MGRYLDIARKVSNTTLPVKQELVKKVSPKRYAAKIYSKILNDTVWVVTHPEAISYVPEGEIYYLPEEIRNLRGSTPEGLQAVHKIKKEIGGQLIMVNDIKEHANN